MNRNALLRFVDLFHALATKEELPPNSEDQGIVLKNLEKLETYAARKEYAERNFKHLSSGSSRLVYLTPGKTIIKLARNDKGLAQNEAEANPKMTSPFLNKIISASKKHIWIETFYLDKITAKEFEKMTGMEFEDFGDAISYGLKNVSDNSGKKKPKKFDEVSKTDIYKEMKRLGEKFELLPGDISRISSWGCKDNHPVLIDSGLTRNIFDTLYDETGSS